MLDRRNPPAEENLRETTEAWIGAFGAALEAASGRALSGLFVADSHWRNLFGISWHFATFSGQRTLVKALAWMPGTRPGMTSGYCVDLRKTQLRDLAARSARVFPKRCTI